MSRPKKRSTFIVTPPMWNTLVFRLAQILAER